MMSDSDDVIPASTPLPNALRWDGERPADEGPVAEFLECPMVDGPDYSVMPLEPAFSELPGGPVEERTVPTLFYAKEGDSLPFKRPTDAGQDLCASKRVQVPAHGRALVHTGLKVAIPAGYEIQVRSRSGLALKRGIMVLNSPGTVDESYRGEVGVILFNTTNEVFDVMEGDKIAQLVLAPVVKYDLMRVERIDSDTDRGEKGFGSSGV